MKKNMENVIKKFSIRKYCLPTRMPQNSVDLKYERLTHNNQARHGFLKRIKCLLRLNGR